jgi:hypothetical protein
VRSASDNYRKGLEDLRDRFTKSSEEDKNALYSKMRKKDVSHDKEMIAQDAEFKKEKDALNRDWSERLKNQENASKTNMENQQLSNRRAREDLISTYTGTLDKQSDDFNDLVTHRNQEFNEKFGDLTGKFADSEKALRSKNADDLQKAQGAYGGQLDDLKKQFLQRDESKSSEIEKQSKLMALEADTDTKSKVEKEHAKAQQTVRKPKKRLLNPEWKKSGKCGKKEQLTTGN